MNIDQKIRKVLWPVVGVLFINTFGMLWYALSGFDVALQSYDSMAVSGDTVFRIVLLVVSLIFGFFVYEQVKKQMTHEFTPSHEYNMRGRGFVGLIMHIILGLVEAAYVLATLSTFWIILNWTESRFSTLMEEVYIVGFGLIFIIAAYIVTRQTALGFLAYNRKG